MTVTPHDFHEIISLRYDETLINLKDVSGLPLCIDLLGSRYPMDTICYFDIDTDYRSLPQTNHDDCAWMARDFLLYILGEYLFANGGQTVYLS